MKIEVKTKTKIDMIIIVVFILIVFTISLISKHDYMKEMNSYINDSITINNISYEITGYNHNQFELDGCLYIEKNIVQKAKNISTSEAK